MKKKNTTESGQKMSDKDVTKFYEELRMVPIGQWPDDVELAKRLSEGAGKAGMPGFGAEGTNEDYARKLRLFGRIAQSCSEKEFLELAKNGDLPPVKLSRQEADVIKGGLPIIVIAVGALLTGAGVLNWEASSKLDTRQKDTQSKVTEASGKQSEDLAKRFGKQ